MKITKEFKIGFWTIAAIAVLFFGIQYLKGINSLKLGNRYFVSCQSVEGLAISSPVRINGFKVGLVRGMEYDYRKTGNVIVEINIDDKDLRIPTDSRASIATDFLGTSTVVLELGEASTYLNLKDTIAGENRTGIIDAAGEMLPAISALVPKIDSLISGVNVLVNESRLQESLLEINVLSERLNTTVSVLNSMLNDEVPDILSNVNSITSNADSITAELKEARIGELITKANETLCDVKTLISSLQNGEGTAGKIISSDELHKQLSETIANVDSLINDIKANPKRYINIRIFGK